MSDETKQLAKLRAMKPKARAKFFRTADPATIEALTEPCTGEAHSNAHIDHCMVCLDVTWGRVLKAASAEDMYARFRAARATYDAVSREIELHALPLVRQALAENDAHKARAIAHKIPGDAIARIFAMDAFREAGVPWILAD